MSLASCRSAIAQVLGQVLTDVNVSEHGGPFTLKELERVMKRTPHVVVVCLGARGEDQASMLQLNATWAAFVVTKDEVGVRDGKRDVQALLIAQQVAAKVMRQRWNQQASGKAQQVDLSNLYSTAIDKVGAALWAVRWKQPVDITQDLVTTPLNNFETFFGTYDLGETPETPATEQQVELDQ